MFVQVLQRGTRAQLSFPCQEMPNEIRAVTDANWAGELEGLRSTSCGWIYFGGAHLLETYSSTQQIVALSQRVSTSRSRRVQLTLWAEAQSGV